VVYPLKFQCEVTECNTHITSFLLKEGLRADSKMTWKWLSGNHS